MTTLITNSSPLVQARVAGFLYLILYFPLNIFGFIYVSSRLIVPGDAVSTTSNIMASESLFRLGIVSTLMGQVVVLLVILTLYNLLKPVNKDVALLMLLFGLVAVPIGVLNEFNLFAIPLLWNNPDHLTLVTTNQLPALVSLLLNWHDAGVRVDEIFLGLWLVPMGYLVFKSGFLPRILGVLLVIVCVGYLIQDFSAFLLPDIKVNIIMITGWGELVFPLWLLIKGVNVELWKKRALAST
jgi:Domain of unknown function (DUF4386)